jgi:MFS family permease
MIPPRSQGAAEGRRKIPRNVRAMGWTSLVNDAASELLYPVLPLYLVVTLHAPAAAVGLVEGAAGAASQIVGYVVGRRSDRIHRRLPFVWAGYTLSNIAKPLVALAPAWGWVLGARVLDRTGKGVRTAPRDALLRDSSDPDRAGATFGYHRFMDSAGATVGPLLALGLLAAGLSLRQVIAVSIVPAVLTMFALRAVREAAPREAPRSAPPPTRDLPRAFWALSAAWVIFSLGNSADVFLLLRARDVGLSATGVVVAYALYNTLYSGLSWPLGHLSDRIGRRRLLTAGLVVFAGVYAGFGLATSTAAMWPLFALYGCYMAATDGVARAFVADLSPAGLRATAQGTFRLLTGGSEVIASIVAGVLWSSVAPGAVFALGAGAAVAGLVLLAAWSPPRVAG